MNIFAYTEIHNPLPSFVSLNVEPGEVAKLGVRQRGENYAKVIDVPDEQLARLADNILVYLAKKQVAQA